MSRVYLIADGPSKKRILRWKERIRGKPVAFVNRSFYDWGCRGSYWFSLHPEEFFQPKYVGVTRQISGGLYQKEDSFYETNEWNKWGTTSLFAAEYLIEKEKFDKVIMYGVDLDHGYYLKYRSEEWGEFYKKYMGRIIDKSYTQWLRELYGGPIGYKKREQEGEQ